MAEAPAIETWDSLERIPHPKIRAFAGYWESKRGDRRAPARADIDPSELRPFLPHMYMLDVVPPGPRIKVRLRGTLRDHLYTDLLLMSLPHAVATGQLFTATAGIGRNYVTREDCAQTAAAALLKATGRQVLDVTGPASVTQDEIAAMASEVAGKTVAHIAVSPDDLRKGLTGAGLPPFLVEALVAFDIDGARGYHAINAPTVQALTGRAPTSVRAFLGEQRAALLAGR